MSVKIKTVGIIGAGAVGSYFIWGLIEKLGDNLFVIADGERAFRLREEGIIINGEKYCPVVKSPEEAAGADLVLISVKYGQLSEAVSQIEEVCGEHTIVMSLLNGVDSEKIIGERIGMNHMLYSMIKIVSKRDGNTIEFDGSVTPGVFFGEPGQSAPTERMMSVSGLFENTPINYMMSKDITADIWGKFAINISRNLPQAIIGCGAGAYEDSEYVKFISSKMREEVLTVAAAFGVDIKAAGWMASNIAPADKFARYSTLQDLDALRHTEIDMFSGAMIRLGKDVGVPTPYNELTFNYIKALEEKNDGKFNY